MKAIVLMATLFYCAVSLANPAPWYRWRSAESDTDVCSQVSPGEAWFKAKGPYQDAVCKKLGVPH